MVKDNREELLEDGLVNASGQETKEILAKSSKNFANVRGYFVCDGIKFNHRNNLLFPRRAILRVGMLLRDTEVAKEVRTQLLNIEEKTSDETKTHDIDEEQSLMLSVGMAVASGDATAVAVASAKLVEFKNRHIKKLENDNKALAEGILEWKDRNKLNAGIRKLAALRRQEQIAVVKRREENHNAEVRNFAESIIENREARRKKAEKTAQEKREA